MGGRLIRRHLRQTGKAFYTGCIPHLCVPNTVGSNAKYFIVLIGLRSSTSNAAKAELLKSSKTQLTPVTIFSVYCHLASASGA